MNQTAEAETEVEEEAEAVEVPSEVAEEAGKVANGELPKETPEVSLSELEREHYEAIKDANCRVSSAQWDYDVAKGKAKEAKERLELVSLELSNLITEGPRRHDPQKKLPFDAASPEATPADEPGEPSVEWQKTPITEILTLTEKQRDKLEEAGIWTIGQFEHMRGGRRADYPDGLRSIKGVGEKTVDKWEDEVVEWLAKNARESEGDDAGSTDSDN